MLLVGATAFLPLAQAQRDYPAPINFIPLTPYQTIQYEWPVSVAVDSRATVYYIFSGRAVQLWQKSPGAPAAVMFSTASSYGADSVAVDPADNVYLLTGGLVRRFTPEGVATSLSATGTFVADSDRTVRASFPGARAIAVDAAGNIYAACGNNHTILKAAPGRPVMTFAGAAGLAGGEDGAAGSEGVSSARFNLPSGIAVDRDGTVFVADTLNHTIRRITPGGIVSTLAGLPASSGNKDGVGNAARFVIPWGITVDASGILYVTDQSGAGLRRITQEGVVTSLGIARAPLAGGGGLDFDREPIAVDREGNFYVTDSWYAAVLMSALPPAFTVQPVSQSVTPGVGAAFTAMATGHPATTYQWRKDDAPIPGATGSTLSIGNVQLADLGTYALVATNPAGSVTSHPATLAFASSSASDGTLVNLSIRGRVGPGAQALIVGFVVGGANPAGTTPLLVRGIGPSLAAFGVPGLLSDPALALRSGSTVIATNDDWNGEPQISAVGRQVGAFSLASAASRDAALFHAGLGAGAYTVQLTGAGDSTGVALAEVYDATPATGPRGSTPRLINLSVRAHVGPGPDALVAGFTIGGFSSCTLMIRAVGPALGAFGVTGALADPKLELFDDNTLLQSNDNWSAVATDTALLTAAAAKVGAFPLAANAKDAALLGTLPPGSYTVHVSGAGGASGVSLVEIYQVP